MGYTQKYHYHLKFNIIPSSTTIAFDSVLGKSILLSICIRKIKTEIKLSAQGHQQLAANSMEHTSSKV